MVDLPSLSSSINFQTEIFLAKWVVAHLYASIAYIFTPTSFICPPKQEYAVSEQGFIFSDACTLKAFILFIRKATPSFSINMFWVRCNAQKHMGIQSFLQEKYLGPYFLYLYSCHIWNLSSMEVVAHVWHTLFNCFIENQRDLELLLLPHREKKPKHWGNQTQKILHRNSENSFYICYLAHLPYRHLYLTCV